MPLHGPIVYYVNVTVNRNYNNCNDIFIVFTAIDECEVVWTFKTPKLREANNLT